MKRTKIRFENSKIKTIIVLALIVALGISAMVGTYQALLSNARTMGMELVRSYCTDEERNIAVYRTYIRMGLYYLEELENSSYSKQEFTHKMENFLKRTAAVVGDSDLQSCVMKNGEKIASNINDKSSLKNYQNTDWYYKARKAAGDVVFCNVAEEKSEGKGTKIIITLPFAPDAEGTFSVDTQPDIQQKDVKEEKEKTINILEGLRIMVVDDNDMNREFVGELLEEQGAIVDLAPGGRESVEMFCQSEEFAHDIILMDIMMPEVDGCEAARLIRSQQRADAEAVLILALTANSFAEDVIRTMESGMNAHLVKPINMKILQETVQKLLEKKNEG